MANDSIETIPIPNPPKQLQVNSLEDAAEAINNIYQYTQQNTGFQNELYNILHSGQLIRSFQVESLTADKLIAGTIGVNQVYLGDDKFELDGSLQQIRVKDDQGSPVTRIEMGAFGSGSDYGLKVRDASGTVVFQATSTTFIDGVILKSASVTHGS